MVRFVSSTLVSKVKEDGILGDRTDLVRVPVGADSSLFGGWGVRI